MRSYANLSDHDFERLVADLFGKHEGRRYETFARGPDLGVDARATDPAGARHVLQCKHMAGSSISQLLSAARRERVRLDGLRPQQRPSTYRFVTSKGLTAANKARLCEVLAPYVRVDADVWGADDLEQLLDAHPEVERAHVKLWLTGRAQLEGIVNAGIWTRSTGLMEQVRRTVKLYVQTDQWAEARDMLADHRVVVLSGPPGIGKTTLADMLLADAVARGYEPVRVSGDIAEAEQVENATTKQAFYYDDFLGSAFLDVGMGKNEDQRLEQFVERCASSTNKLFILTTREHLLQAALDTYEQLSTGTLPLRKVTLEMRGYSRLQRAEVVYNHVRASPHVRVEVLRQLTDRRAYLQLVDHDRFRPRLIRYLAGRLFNEGLPPQRWLAAAVAVLDDPSRVWRHAFSQQLREPEKLAVIALASLPNRVPLEVADAAYASIWQSQAGDRPIGASLQQVLQVTEGTFTATERRSRERLRVSLYDPSVQDFIADWLRARPTDLRQALSGTSYLEQDLWLYSAVIARMPAVSAALLSLVAGRIRQHFISDAACSPRPDRDRRLRSIEIVVSGDARLRELLQWLDRRFAERVARWKVGEVMVNAAIELVLQVKTRGVDIGEAVQVLRDVVVKRVQQVSVDRNAWDDYVEVAQRLDASGSDLLDERRHAFFEWAQACLDDGAADLNDIDDLNALVMTGEGFGGGVDALASFDDVRERFEDREWEPDSDEWRSSGASVTVRGDEEDRQIDALFARFADDS